MSLSSPQKRGNIFSPTLVCVCVSVCLSVNTITKKLWTDLHQILCEGTLREMEDQVRVSLRSVEGCGSNGQKTP